MNESFKFQRPENHSITFCGPNNQFVGKLEFRDTGLVFTGDADASALRFVEALGHHLVKGEIATLRAKVEKMEAEDAAGHAAYSKLSKEKANLIDAVARERDRADKLAIKAAHMDAELNDLRIRVRILENLDQVARDAYMGMKGENMRLVKEAESARSESTRLRDALVRIINEPGEWPDRIARSALGYLTP